MRVNNDEGRKQGEITVKAIFGERMNKNMGVQAVILSATKRELREGYLTLDDGQFKLVGIY